MTEQYYQYRTSLNIWGSVCITLTFLFKINSMSRLREQLWAHLSPIVANLYMEYFERKTLMSAINPPRYELGLWMTLGSFSNRPINRHSWITSIALIQQSSLQWKVLKVMGLSPSLIPWSCL